MAQLGNTIINGSLVVSGAVTINGSITGDIENATNALHDGAGRTISSSYGASVSVSGSVLSLIAPDAQVLSTASIVAAVKAYQDNNGVALRSGYANAITLASSILSLKAPDGSVLSTALISTADTLQAITANGATTDKAISITNTTAATNTTSGALKVAGGVGVAGDLYAAKVYGAYWNDYAEYRITNCKLKYGRVVCEVGDDSLKLSTKRLQKGAYIISDTFGFSIGESEQANTPIAVSGRALAYTDKDRYEFKIGNPVCSGKDGTVSQMTKLEAILYPECIVGFVSAIPEYEYWGTHHIKVDGRIWINIK